VIIRILHEGQYEVPDDVAADLDALDNQLVTTIDTDDAAAFTRVLADLLAAVRRAGTPLPDQVLAPSELVLPAADAQPAQVRALMGDDGLIPG
jgi:PspAA-like protein